MINEAKEKTLIIIPCFNEQNSIETLLLEILDFKKVFSILVIDDGSSDETYNRAIKYVPVIKLTRNLGIGGAVQTGIKYAKLKNFDFCIQVDGDGQHIPFEILKLLDCYKCTESSIVIGSRYINKISFKSTLARRVGSRFISTTLSIFFGNIKLTDPTSGFRLYDKKSIDFFSKNYPHDFPEPISIAWALKEGLAIKECSVLMRSRVSGISSISGLKTIIYMVRVLSYIILARFFRHKM